MSLAPSTTAFVESGLGVTGQRVIGFLPALNELASITLRCSGAQAEGSSSSRRNWPLFLRIGCSWDARRADLGDCGGGGGGRGPAGSQHSPCRIEADTAIAHSHTRHQPEVEGGAHHKVWPQAQAAAAQRGPACPRFPSASVPPLDSGVVAGFLILRGGGRGRVVWRRWRRTCGEEPEISPWRR
jgi:hypothetical protein